MNIAILDHGTFTVTAPFELGEDLLEHMKEQINSLIQVHMAGLAEDIRQHYPAAETRWTVR